MPVEQRWETAQRRARARRSAPFPLNVGSGGTAYHLPERHLTNESTLLEADVPRCMAR
jgi:hypothetical protein